MGTLEVKRILNEVRKRTHVHVHSGEPGTTTAEPKRHDSRDNSMAHQTTPTVALTRIPSALHGTGTEHIRSDHSLVRRIAAVGVHDLQVHSHQIWRGIVAALRGGTPTGQTADRACDWHAQGQRFGYQNAIDWVEGNTDTKDGDVIVHGMGIVLGVHEDMRHDPVDTVATGISSNCDISSHDLDLKGGDKDEPLHLGQYE